jgi:hypothetical protein
MPEQAGLEGNRPQLAPPPEGAFMIARLVVCATIISVSAGSAIAQSLTPVPVLAESPWNGDWILSQTRNTAEIKAMAADGYRFHLQPDGRIRWEIPSLHEVVEGRVDGRPMPIRVGFETLKCRHLFSPRHAAHHPAGRCQTRSSSSGARRGRHRAPSRTNMRRVEGSLATPYQSTI